jgi:hypothetical protein
MDSTAGSKADHRMMSDPSTLAKSSFRPDAQTQLTCGKKQDLLPPEVVTWLLTPDTTPNLPELTPGMMFRRQTAACRGGHSGPWPPTATDDSPLQ